MASNIPPAGMNENRRRSLRLRQIENSQATGGVIGANLYGGGAVVRHHRDIRAGENNLDNVEENNLDNVENILNQVHGVVVQIKEGLVQLRVRLNQGFKRMEQRFNIAEARRAADHARNFNYNINPRADSHFRPLPKYIPGHPVGPNLPPAAIPNVVFAQGYDIGNLPPPNLMPVNNPAFLEWHNMDELALSIRLLGLYWFYNDPRLALAVNAPRSACLAVLERLKEFMLQN